MKSNRLRPISFAPSARLAVLGLTGAPLLAASLTLAKIAHADVVGRLKFSVKNAADEKPVAGAKIVLKDSAKVRPDVTLTTDATGNATTPPLENRSWNITVSVDKFQNDTRDVTVVADTTSDIEVLLEPLQEKVIKVTGQRDLVRLDNTGNSKVRDQSFIRQLPTTATNPQSLNNVLRTNPGFVVDSVNQLHPRAEHSQTSIYINGFLLPGALQGRAGQFLSPETIQTLDVQTGGFAPEYGAELAAVLNLTLRSGTIAPFSDVSLGGGSYSTYQGSLTFGGQGGASFGAPVADGPSPKRFGYLVNVTQRNTSNAIEPPQPDNQTTHNKGNSSTLFGNFDYKLNTSDTLTLTLNTAPARTEVADRTGLPDKYKAYGQGFGYGGAQSAGSTTTDASGNTIPLVSQEQAGQDIYQKDSNTFAALLYRRQLSANTTGLFSVGYSRSQLDVLNHNPSIDLAALPADSSIEFSPNIKRAANQVQFQANVTVQQTSAHTIKFGGLYQDQRGDESYQLVPGSQTALNALLAIDPQQLLVPQGGTVGEDEAGNPTYTLAPGGNYSSPTLKVKRSGYYAALYGQDTYKATRKLTVNYGLRFDAYKAKQDVSGQSDVNKNDLSPRVNVAYAINPRTVFRTSYNHLFTQPPLAQGAVLGESIKPQTVNLYEASLERQFGGNQTAKVAYYEKDFKNVTDTGILIEGTQIGVYTTHNLEKAIAKGFELSYDLQPRGGVGPGAYLGWANVVDKPSGKDSSTGEELPAGGYTDHDALNTITAGFFYAIRGGASAGLTYYYTTGVESSRLIDPTTGIAGNRQSRSEVGLRLSTPRRPNGHGIGADLAVENLFDSHEVINFQSAFSGTRFQQGRRVLLTLNGHF